ncbi:hypothetical protein [Hymenobacter bucti]|uniref:Uncharacterized protein n=1 Tax=Hymenobacter bucti TaxID=1844114 RepID=A0ABW4QN44_9BACT
MSLFSKFPLFALLALPLVGQAQATSTDLGRDLNGNFNNGYSLIPPDDNLLRESTGLLAGWVPASVLLAGNKTPTVVPLKYDLYRQELRVRRAKGDSVVVPLSRVQEFTLQPAATNARRFVCYPAASLPPEAGGGCGEALTSGTQLQLLKFWKKTVVKRPGESNSYASNTSVSHLEDQTAYYLRWADGRFVPVRLKRASLEQALAGQPAALAALKARKGNLGSEADMAAALLALDPLLTAPAK